LYERLLLSPGGGGGALLLGRTMSITIELVHRRRR